MMGGVVMQEYSYNDFITTLSNSEKIAANVVYDYIVNHCPEYKPFNIKPLNRTSTKWQVNFRKKPEFGKAFCSLYSVDGKLSIRVIGSGSMNYELFLRQNEFGDKVRGYIFYNGFCEKCSKTCRSQWHNSFREYWYINGELLVSGCKKNVKSAEYTGIIDDYPAIHNVTEGDIKDLLYLLAIQARHINKPKNAKEIRGAGYAETSKKRCGDVAVAPMEHTELDIDDFEASDYCNTKRLDKYANEYSLTPMGVSDGLWFFHDTKAVCGETGNDYSHTMIPKGQYASVVINDPFSYSAWGAWTYIAGWMRENNVNIRQLDFSETGAPYLAKFYKQSGSEYMAVFVPIFK
jgi:hypothetical protein